MPGAGRQSKEERLRPEGESAAVLDPLSAMIVVGCLTAVALGPTSLLSLALTLGACLCWTIAAAMPMKLLIGRVKKASFFLLVIFVTGGITGNGAVLAHGGGIYVTGGGLEGGLVQAARLILVLWGATLFVWTTMPAEILDAIGGWTGRKGRPILAAGIVAFNYLPMFVQSARRIVIARRARGEADPRWLPDGLSHIARAALPLFAAALRNADALADAMESRCFDPLAPRTPWRKPRRSSLGLAVVICAIAFASGAVLGLL